MEVEEARGEYAVACRSLAAELDRHFTGTALDEIYRDARLYSLYAAMFEGEIFGFATVRRKNAGVAEISFMAVRSEHQSRGLGKKLLARIERDLSAEDVSLLMVKTLSQDSGYPPYEATRRFYEAASFLHLETVDPYPGWQPGDPCAVYVKVL